ncbi:DUF2971 domain-containing protein [Bacillus safensis]|uniref:DUF2971 domain-containing protein n=1 Tax=Bacillus safensis TaxID=561879 RepID=UPI0018CF454D|nr:DUF2971 domain-containing protein [Bacillus safensis]MBG9821744.1 hypothetical protein [Bacillus safensis]GMG79557.1 DUF2971 domain-containing protein [Bacillus safensis]
MKENNEVLLNEIRSKYYKDYIYPLLKYNSDEIFHYTNIYGLQGILSDEKFWVSHSDFLNDKTEKIYTLDLCTELFRNICKEKKLKDEEKDKYIKSYKDIMNMYFVNYKQELYTLSFSTNPDSNLLWANYSQNDGYCISFNLFEILGKIINQKIVASNVIYDKETQKNTLKGIISNIFEIIKRNPRGNINKKDAAELKIIGEILTWCSIFFKDVVFSQEQEFRISFFGGKNNYKCRISNGVFIPYIEWGIDKAWVSGVTIGPKNSMDINIEGLRKFLDLNSYNLSDEKIRKSKIPYRY